MDEGWTGYAPSAGLEALREALAEWLNERYGLDVKPGEVAVTAGAKAAIFAALACLIDEGDEVIVPDPCYPSYDDMIKFLGGVPRPVRLREEDGWALRVEDVEAAISPRTRAILLNFPHNPTGSMLSGRRLMELLELAEKRGLAVISDEVYEFFVYEGRHVSSLSHPDWRGFVAYVNSFSKTFSMTGWRLGFLVASEKLASKAAAVANVTYSCVPPFVQLAGVAAIENWREWVRELAKVFRERRDVMVEELGKVPGVRLVKPRGAFYAFPNVSELMDALGYSSPEQLSRDLLRETGVLVLSGTSFPFEAGRGWEPPPKAVLRPL